MKKKLYNQIGFTLVELLVVIAIIAILSVVGLTLFSGAQANARDARRKTDVDAIANALESNRPTGTAFYKAPTDGSWFSSGAIPTDTTAAKYCIKTYTTDNGAAAPTETPTTWNASGASATSCPGAPTGYLQAVTSSGVTSGDYGFDTTAGKSFPDTTIRSWKICARLEASTADTGTNLQVYCKNSAQ